MPMRAGVSRGGFQVAEILGMMMSSCQPADCCADEGVLFVVPLNTYQAHQMGDGILSPLLFRWMDDGLSKGFLSSFAKYSNVRCTNIIPPSVS